MMTVVMEPEVGRSEDGRGPHAGPRRVVDERKGVNLGFAERVFSSAGAAVLSAVVVNPLNFAKLFADLRCSPSCSRTGMHGTVSICPPDCFHYKGTLDTFCKIVRQEGLRRLWRGTNAGLALAVPTVGLYLPCYEIFRNSLEKYTTQIAPGSTPHIPLLAGLLACSLACVSCYPIELARTHMQSQTIKEPPEVWKTA